MLLSSGPRVEDSRGGDGDSGGVAWELARGFAGEARGCEARNFEMGVQARDVGWVTKRR
jgi:hypothetical protein